MKFYCYCRQNRRDRERERETDRQTDRLINIDAVDYIDVDFSLPCAKIFINFLELILCFEIFIFIYHNTMRGEVKMESNKK